MPWTVKDPPRPARNWTESEKKRCVAAANKRLAEGGKDAEQQAIFACIRAAGKSTKKEDDSMNDKFYIIDGEVVALKELVEAWVGKATWKRAYINDLPDSCFLYVESGDKDDEGKTKPRSKRHFPYKDASGKVDVPHLRNAIQRIPQSNAPGLSAEKKTQLQNRARRMLAQIQGKDEKKDVKKDTSLSDYSNMIRNAFYEFKGPREDKRDAVEVAYNAYVREIYDSYVIVEEDNELYAYPYTFNGKDFSFSMGIKVEITYIPVGKKHVEVDKKEESIFEVPIVKADEEKHLVYGAVLIPDTRDSQGDIITAEEIEKTAHAYLIQSRTIDNRHAEALPLEKARPVESYILPQNTTLGKKELPAGTWIMTVHIPDDGLWEAVKSGELNAFSIYGVGKRKRVH